jgi:hypothetical protein
LTNLGCYLASIYNIPKVPKIPSYFFACREKKILVMTSTERWWGWSGLGGFFADNDQPEAALVTVDRWRYIENDLIVLI